MQKKKKAFSAIREMQIRMTLKFYVFPVKMAIISQTITNASEAGASRDPYSLLMEI